METRTVAGVMLEKGVSEPNYPYPHYIPTTRPSCHGIGFMSFPFNCASVELDGEVCPFCNGTGETGAVKSWMLAACGGTWTADVFMENERVE